jgi:hypothetical protein
VSTAASDLAALRYVRVMWQARRGAMIVADRHIRVIWGVRADAMIITDRRSCDEQPATDSLEVV